MRQIAISFILILALTVFTIPAFAAGPWKGKVIDAETKKPIEGAVVLAVWDRNYRTPTGGNSYFYEAKEVLTDKDGRFEIVSYTPINLLPLISYIEGPFFTIFKPGYGSFPWHRVYPPMNIPPDEFFAAETSTEGEIGWDYEKEKKVKVTFGIVELPPLKTREERIKVLPGSSDPFRNHYDKKKEYMKLLSIESKELGLEPETEPIN